MYEFYSGKGFLRNLDLISLGPWDRRYQYVKEMRNTIIKERFETFESLSVCAEKFTRRITSICWHQKYPNTYAVGSKFGDIIVRKVLRSRVDSSELKLSLKGEIKGPGAGGSITAMQFDNDDMMCNLYRTSIDSTVSKINLEDPSKSLVYHDFNDYNLWFTSMDIEYGSKTLLAGNNKGLIFMFNLDGKEKGRFRLHKAKVHHIEFNKKNPYIFATASTSDKEGTESVKIWDIRKLDSTKPNPLKILAHKSGVNTATFDHTDGSRLLTSDQQNEIRVYQGPLWEDFKTITHWHRQFQHITPIIADWHPLADLIVIGKYPKDNSLRTVQFFNPESGHQVAEIVPPLNNIVSLNVFNPTGEFLASGTSTELLIWRPTLKLDGLGGRNLQSINGVNPGGLSQASKDRIRRGATSSSSTRSRKREEYSPVNSDDEGDANKNDQKKTKRPRKVASTSIAKTKKRENSDDESDANKDKKNKRPRKVADTSITKAKKRENSPMSSEEENNSKTEHQKKSKRIRKTTTSSTVVNSELSVTPEETATITTTSSNRITRSVAQVALNNSKAQTEKNKDQNKGKK